MTDRVVAIFGSESAARRAQAAVEGEGVQVERVGVQADLAQLDGIGAEAPGESFENQPGESRAASDRAGPGETARSGGWVVTVLADPSVHPGIEAILRRNGARRVYPG